jgi:Transglycosylase SLT domain
MPHSRRGRSAIVGVGGGVLLLIVAAVAVHQVTAPSKPQLPTIPPADRATVESAAHTCSQLSVPLLAAQIAAESGWRADADSGHAQGIAQFSPVTWAEWGRDGNGDGKADVWDPKDAIPAQAHYMCHLFDMVKDVPGNPTRLALAAYNAGPNAVLAAQGIPTIHETQQYVDRIVDILLPQYRKSYAQSQAHASASPSAG